MKIDENGMCALSDEDRSYHTRAPKQKRTNADRIRAMTDEELAQKISGLESFALTCGSAMSPEKWLEWLKQEADNE